VKSKKYYTISEVAKVLNVLASRLRYFEKSIPKFAISKVKGRRYYTLADIEIIKQELAKSKKQLIDYSKGKMQGSNSSSTISKIDSLIDKFDRLAFRISGYI